MGLTDGVLRVSGLGLIFGLTPKDSWAGRLGG